MMMFFEYFSFLISPSIKDWEYRDYLKNEWNSQTDHMFYL